MSRKCKPVIVSWDQSCPEDEAIKAMATIEDDADFIDWMKSERPWDIDIVEPTWNDKVILVRTLTALKRGVAAYKKHLPKKQEAEQRKTEMLSEWRKRNH